MLLRATARILKRLPEDAARTDASDTALGDWYVNRIVIDRQPLLLLVSAESRLAMLSPARDLKGLPGRLGAMVDQRLARLGVSGSVVRAEVGATGTVRVGRALNRSITGQMVNFAKAIPYYLPVNGWDEGTLRKVEDRLAETPCLCGRSAGPVWPRETAVRLLENRWPNNGVLH